MHSRRVSRGRGDDLKGKTIRSRTAGIDTDFLSPLEKGMVMKQLGEDLRPSAGPKRGAEPRADPAASGSKVEHVGMYGAPTIYRESYGGRKGTKGKRRSEM